MARRARSGVRPGTLSWERFRERLWERFGKRFGKEEEEMGFAAELERGELACGRCARFGRSQAIQMEIAIVVELLL